MERFVQYVVAGGLALLAGLWATELTGAWSAAWMVSAAIALAGAASLAVGIWRELDWRPSI